VYIDTLYWEIPSCEGQKDIVVAKDARSKGVTIIYAESKHEMKNLIIQRVKRHNKYIKI
jgi:hypothetical protein